MTLVVPTEFSGFVIAIGDGADPEVFTPKCTLNSSKGFSMTGETTARNIPDCDNDLLPSATLNYITAIGGEISGSGVLNAHEDKFFADWLKSGAAKNVRVSRGGTGGTRYAMAAKITAFNITAETKDLVQCEITLVSHGEITISTIS
jgi:hypothetical protein